MRNRLGSRAVGVSIAAVLGLAIWLLWSPAPTQPTGNAALGAAAGQLAVAGADGDAVEPGSDVAVPQRITAEPRAAAADSDAQARWLTVRRRDSKAAVAGAEVWLLPGSELQSLAEPPAPAALRLDTDYCALACSRGQREVADALGRVRLSERTGSLLAVAAAAGLFGRARVDLRRHAPIAGDTLWLDRDVTLRVHVVAGAGASQAGVPVAMGWRLRENGYERRRQIAAAISDADGMASIAHAQLTPDSWWPTTTLSAWVTFAAPGFAGPDVAIDLEAPPAQPIELVLPGTGRIAFQADPACADGEASVLLYGLDADGQRSEVSAYGWRQLPASGQVEFDRVHLGQRFAASLRSGVVGCRREFAGPTRAGEVVVVRFELPEQVVLRGRAVQDDRPFARQRLRYELQFRDATYQDADGRLQRRPRAQGTTLSDADGRFAMLFDGSLRGCGVLSCWLHPLAEQSDPDHAGAWIDVQQLPLAGERDLGDVPLQVPPLLVDGEVFFDDGTPCRDHGVRVELPREPGESGVDWEQRWIRLRVGGKGEHFTVRGTFAGPQLRLVADSPSAAADAGQMVSVPQHGVRLVVTRAGSMLARLRADGDFDPERIEVFLRLPGGERLPPPGVDSEVDADGALQYRIGGLRAGSYDFCAALPGQPQTEVRVRDVVVRAGEVTRDPRLDDLSFAARKIMLRLLDAHSGAAIEGRAVVIFERPEGGRWSGIDFFAGQEIVVQGSPEGRICALDHEPITVQLEGDQLTVRLPPCTVPTTLALAGPPPEVPMGLRLRLRLDPVLNADEKQRPDTPGGGAIMADFLGRVPRHVELPWSGDVVTSPPRGRYRLRLELIAADGSAAIEGVEPAELELQVPSRVTVQVPAAAWQRAIAALAK